MTISWKRELPIFGLAGIVGGSVIAALAAVAYMASPARALTNPQTKTPAPAGDTVIGCKVTGGIVMDHGCNVNIDHSVHVRKTTVYTKDPNVGVLYPSNEPLVEHAMTGNSYLDQCFRDAVSWETAGSGGLAMNVGTNVVIMWSFPITLLAMENEPMIRVNKRDGKLVVEMVRVIDDRDNQIVRIDQDGYSIDPESHAHVTRPDKSTLIVEDHLGRQVLKIKYTNPQSISLDGVFRYPSLPAIAFTGDKVHGINLNMGDSCLKGVRNARPVIDISKESGIEIG